MGGYLPSGNISSSASPSGRSTHPSDPSGDGFSVGDGDADGGLWSRADLRRGAGRRLTALVIELAAKRVFFCFAMDIGIGVSPSPGASAGGGPAGMGVGGLDGLRVKFWPSGLVRRRRVVFGRSGCGCGVCCFFRIGGGRIPDALCLSVSCWHHQYCGRKWTCSQPYLLIQRNRLILNQLKQSSQSRPIQRAKKPVTPPDPPEEILEAMADGAWVDSGVCVEH